MGVFKLVTTLIMPTTVFQANFFKVYTGWPLAGGFVSAGSGHGGGDDVAVVVVGVSQGGGGGGGSLLHVLGIILHHGGLPAHVAEAFAVDGSGALAALGTGARLKDISTPDFSTLSFNYGPFNPRVFNH